jgi:putative oxidoreductase
MRAGRPQEVDMQRIIDLAAAAGLLAARIGNALWWLGPTLGRIVVGVVFVQSGWGKLHDLPSVTEYFASLGLPNPGFQAALASTTELVCGALLLAGLATRFAVVPLIITMCVAIRTALWDQVDGIASTFSMIEGLYIVLCVWLGTTGAGPLSIDARLARWYTQPIASAARPQSARALA